MQSWIKITLAIIALAAVVAAGLFVFTLFKTAPQQGTDHNTFPTDTGGNTSPSTVVTTVPSGSASSPTSTAASVVDVAVQYDALFARILAQPIAFDRVSASTTGEKAAIYKLYAGDVATEKEIFPAEINPAIGVYLGDLGSDGVAEAIVSEDMPGFCGTAGCTLNILEKQKNAWVKIYSTTVLGEVGLANTATRGMRDLYFTVSDSSSGVQRVMRYVWDGAKYNPGEVMAVWNGFTFVSPQ